MAATPITIVSVSKATLLIYPSAERGATEYAIVARGGTPAAMVGTARKVAILVSG